MHATGLAILGSHMYWTDNRQHALLQADKETGTQLDILEEDLEIPMTVAAFSRDEKPGTKLICMRHIRAPRLLHSLFQCSCYT